MTDRMLAGRCYCGAVHYEVADAFGYAMNCRCSRCRQTTGAAFKPLAGIERDRLRVTAGGEHLQRYGDELRNNMLCRECGSLLWSVVREGKWVHVAMGTLVDAPSIRPQRHIFVGSRAPWYEITDDLPQHQEFPR
jgi:hypothetical protein